MFKLEKYTKPILRISLSLVFLYFGFMQIISSKDWIGFIPNFALTFGISATNLVFMNAFLEIIFGSLLLIGLYTRVSSIILSIHLFGIASFMGFNPLGIRDFGLAFATFVVFLNGIDRLCLDNKFLRSK